MRKETTGVSAVETTRWASADTEDVRCCVCDVPGRRRYDLPPFGVVTCPRCGLVFVSPRLRPDALQRVYDDEQYFAGVYGDEGGWSPAMALQRTWTAGRLDLIQSALGRPVRGASLLEVGCGYGRFLSAARDRGYTVSGVELSRPAVEQARKQGLDVHCGQLIEADLPDAGADGGYDVICAWDTLEHVPDPLAFLTEVRRLLAVDGVFAFSTPYFSSLPARLLGTRWWTLKPTEHIWHFTPRTHQIVAARAGLAVTKIVRNPLARANLTRLDSLVGLARRLR